MADLVGLYQQRANMDRNNSNDVGGKARRIFRYGTSRASGLGMAFRFIERADDSRHRYEERPEVLWFHELGPMNIRSLGDLVHRNVER